MVRGLPSQAPPLLQYGRRSFGGARWLWFRPRNWSYFPPIVGRSGAAAGGHDGSAHFKIFPFRALRVIHLTPGGFFPRVTGSAKYRIQRVGSCEVAVRRNARAGSGGGMRGHSNYPVLDSGEQRLGQIRNPSLNRDASCSKTRQMAGGVRSCDPRPWTLRAPMLARAACIFAAKAPPFSGGRDRVTFGYRCGTGVSEDAAQILPGRLRPRRRSRLPGRQRNASRLLIAAPVSCSFCPRMDNGRT